MGAELEDFVRQRAGGRCEYCHDPVPPFHIEHIIARKHGGQTVAENLALSCIACNLHKGPNLSGIDPTTRAVVQLYNPRIHRRLEHSTAAAQRSDAAAPPHLPSLQSAVWPRNAETVSFVTWEQIY